MNTKKTDVKFYVEEFCCDCGGSLNKIEKKTKHGRFFNYGLTDTTTTKYKCKECGREYSDKNIDLFNSNQGRFIVFEYNGKKYSSPLMWKISHED